MTMDKEGETNVSISGITDKRWITATCSIILDNRYHLPLQLIYKGKSNQVLPNVSFSKKPWKSKSPNDVFCGQTTDKVLKILEDNNILVSKFPPGMKYLLPLFDFSANKVAANIFMKQKFSDWFTRQISLGLENGEELDDVKFDYSLSLLKPLHAK